MEHEKETRNSVIVMTCTLVSRLLGIVKARAIATIFGASGVADVINFTFNIPNNFRKLFAEGALSSAYIPVFTSLIVSKKGSIEDSSLLLARMQGFQLLFSIPLLLCTYLFRSHIISFLSDFKDVQLQTLSQDLLTYFLVFLVTISFSALYSGLLHSHNRFLVASVAPLLFSLSVISSLYLLHDRIGPYAMVVGVIVGGILQGATNWIALSSLGYRFSLSFDFSHHAFIKVLRGWGPVTITALIAIISQQVAFYFASSLSEGSITAFSNAIIIWQAPYGIFYTAIATVFFPAMVIAWKKGENTEFRHTVERGLSYCVTFLLPAAIALIVLRKETVAVLLQSGRFTYQDTLTTSSIVLFFSLGMPIVAWYGFLQRLCYSVGIYRSTIWVAAFVSLLDIGTMWYGITVGWGVQSLSIANSIAHFGGTIAIMIVLRGQKIVYCTTPKLVARIMRLLVANIPLCVAFWFYHLYGNHTWWISGSTIANGARLMLLYSGAVGITILSYMLFRVEFLDLLFRRKRVKSTH